MGRDGRSKEVDVTLGSLDNASFAGKSGNWQKGSNSENTVLDGIQIDDIDNRWRQRFQIPARLEGVVVVDVDQKSAAYRAGIRPGDVILSINRDRVSSAEEALELGNNLEENRVLL